jgi:excisionase family DNA binding protein
MTNEWLTPKEAAELLGVSLSTVYMMTGQCKLEWKFRPGAWQAKRRIEISRKSIGEYLASMHKPSIS